MITRTRLSLIALLVVALLAVLPATAEAQSVVTDNPAAPVAECLITPERQDRTPTGITRTTYCERFYAGCYTNSNGQICYSPSKTGP